MEEKTIKIDIGRCLNAMLRKFYIILGLGVIFASVMYFYMKDKPTLYTATASVYSAASGSYTESAQGINALQLYSNVIVSRKLAVRASSLISGMSVSPEQIMGMVTTTTKEESPIIYITAKSSNPNVVIATANALAQSFVIEAQSTIGTQAIQILDEATFIGIVNPKVKRNVALAFIVGAFIPALIIALMEILSDRVYRVEDASLDDKLEIIGIIPDQKIS